MRFSGTAWGCPRAGSGARGALEAGAGAGPRAGTCPPPTAAGLPPPCCSPPRPFSCAKAATQIRTDSAMIVFNVNLPWRNLARELVARDAPTLAGRSLRYAWLGVVTHVFGSAGLGSRRALTSIMRANWLFLLLLFPDLAARAADVCNPADLVVR